MNAERMKFAGITTEDFVVTQEILAKSPMSLHLRSKRKISLFFLGSSSTGNVIEYNRKQAPFVCNYHSFTHFCFSAAVSALYRMPFAESCLTLLCTNTWASVQTEQCPPISSRFRQPLFTLILLTHSGSSLETKMESFTWEWVLVGPWVGYKDHWCYQGVRMPCHFDKSIKCSCKSITASQSLLIFYISLLKVLDFRVLKSLLLLYLKTLNWESKWFFQTNTTLVAIMNI